MSPQLEPSYLTLAEGLPSALLIHDERKVLFANPAAAQMFRAKTTAELVGRPWTRFLHPSSLQDAKETVTEVLQGSYQRRGEVDPRRCVRLDGSTFEAQVARTAFDWDGKRTVQVIVRDVTAELTVEQTLAESEALRERLLHAMPGGIVQVWADGSIRSANDEACRILGLTWDELSERFTHDFDPETIHLDGSHCSVEEYPVTRALVDGTVQQPMTIGVRRPGGRVSWAVFTAVPVTGGEGETVGAVVTLLDVSERIANEAAAARRADQQNVLSELGVAALVEDDLPTLFEEVVERVTTTLDVPHAHILQWDAEHRRLERVAGRGHLSEYDLEELSSVGDVAGLGPEATETAAGKPWFPQRSTVERWPTGEVRVTARLASIIHGRIAPFGMIVAQTNEPRSFQRDDQAFVDGIANLLAAAGERRRIERRRADLEVQLRQQQKLDSLGTLASGVAHEINNPIQGIMSYAELIRVSAAAGSRQGNWAEQIVQGTERIAVIVRNMLAFARPEAAGRNTVEVRGLINRTLSLVRTVLRKDQIALEVDVSDGLPGLECQAQQIQQVLMNLVVNARDALNARFEGFDRRKKVRITTARFVRDRQPWIRIVVNDSGIGIAKDDIERVFDPFFTTKRQDRGTGLGLSVSHGIVVEHHGRLYAESEPGNTSFFLELPARAAKPDAGPVP